MSDDAIIDTIAEKVARATWGEGSGAAWDSLPKVARTGIIRAASAQVEATLAALREQYAIVELPKPDEGWFDLWLGGWNGRCNAFSIHAATAGP